MESLPIRTVAMLALSFVLSAAPSFAQRERDGRRDGDGRGLSGRVERAQPGRGEQPRGRYEGRIEPRGRSESQGRHDVSRGRDDRAVARRPPYDSSFGNRGDSPRRYRDRVYDERSFGDRRNVYPSYGRRFQDDRSYRYRGHRSYGYRPHGRSYVLPYGYRPYGYRPGWSLNLYFGRPHYAYGYPRYDYPGAGYGYYSFMPGRAYGALRIVDAPHDAQVLVDGFYAGLVDDYDGVFQHLNLEVGPHHIEIEAPGYPPIAFEVHIQPGQTITYRANLDY